MKNVEIYNSKGELVTLDPVEQAAIAEAKIKARSKEIMNALGIELNITTMTEVIKGVVTQKFFTVQPSLYMPVKVGVGAWSTNLLRWVETSISTPFETGIINTGGNNTRLTQADAGLDSITVPVNSWAKEITWALPELAMAQRAANWDVVEAKERARKKNWDLGIQQVAFLGGTNAQGLLTLSTPVVNTTLITKPIKNMNATEFNLFLQNLISAYRLNANYTAFPDRFYIPEADFTGLGAATDETFPLKSKLERLTEALQQVTMNPDFKVLPLVYSSQNFNGLGKNRYVLMNYDSENLEMNIPVDYTPTAQGTLNNFQFQNVAYGQYSGPQVFRPQTIMYFDFVGTIN